MENTDTSEWWESLSVWEKGIIMLSIANGITDAGHRGRIIVSFLTKVYGFSALHKVKMPELMKMCWDNQTEFLWFLKGYQQRDEEIKRFNRKSKS
jgi:hypothetical protein